MVKEDLDVERLGKSDQERGAKRCREVKENAQERTSCVGERCKHPLRAASLHGEVPTYLHWSVKLGKNVHLSEKAPSAPFYEVPYVQYLPKSSGYIAARQTEKRQYRASHIKDMGQSPAGNMHAPFSFATLYNHANSQTLESRTWSKTWLP
jgi:hypothetical protein